MYWRAMPGKLERGFKRRCTWRAERSCTTKKSTSAAFDDQESQCECAGGNWLWLAMYPNTRRRYKSAAGAPMANRRRRRFFPWYLAGLCFDDVDCTARGRLRLV